MKAANQPQIMTTPISYHDASPILKNLGGPEAPRAWQGALPFTYHLGPGMVKVHLALKIDYQIYTIWDVIGKVHGNELPDEWVIAGNHRDAWVYGACDPNSGTAAMLESVHGLGALLKKGWKPKRSILFASWDAEEEGLIGSTEWVEQKTPELQHAVAYFNTDVAVSGPNFDASAVPSLAEFIRDATKQVPSPKGGTVYEQWLKHEESAKNGKVHNVEETHVGVLGSGSDFTPFFQHAGIPSTDIGSQGPYGVYHSAFDNYSWFIKNADPDFVYLQEMARVFGLEILHMADADVLPLDYTAYARWLHKSLEGTKQLAKEGGMTGLDFTPVFEALDRFSSAADTVQQKQLSTHRSNAALDSSLVSVEKALLSEEGLPKRPWYKHTIFAPGEYTGYEAVVFPGVTEAIEGNDTASASHQLMVLKQALERAASVLEQTK
jgi:N-acetylated-alpha-linked acidic dipeptidase